MKLLAMLAVVLLAGLGLPQGAEAQTRAWTNTVPPNLEGRWVEFGERCEDADSQLMIFSDGGYRWRRARTDWGFARGQYSYVTSQPHQVQFRVRRLVQHQTPDYQLAISGTQLRVYSYGSGEQRRLEKCAD